MSGVLLVLTGLVPLWLAGRDLGIRWDPDAVHVVATVDRVERYCDKGGCSWDSFGHYVVAGKPESGVMVATGRATPARGPQPIIVDPHRPADVVNADESPAGMIAGGVTALLIGVAFLWIWSRPVIANRRARPLPAAPQESSAAQWQRLGQARLASRGPQDALTTPVLAPQDRRDAEESRREAH